MTTVLSAIVPIVLILLMGKLVSMTRWLTDEGWIGLESITYYVLFPALIISKLATADFALVDWRLPFILISAQFIMAIVSIAIAKASKQQDRRIGVLVQSGVRWNTFIALAIAQDLMGPSGLAMVAAVAAAMIPTANTLSVLALMRFSGADVQANGLLRQLVFNPLILACAAGLALNQVGMELPASLADVLEILAQATIAVGLLATGVHIRLREGEISHLTVLGWSLLRLAALPVIAGSLCLLIDAPKEIFLVVMIATSVPTASNGAILARQLGGDARLAANLIALQTVLAALSITAVLLGAEALRLT